MNKHVRVCLRALLRITGKREEQECGRNQIQYIKTNSNTKKIEKKLEHSRKVVEELEMDHLMLRLQNGGMLADLSQTKIEKLMSYASKKLLVWRDRVRYNTSVRRTSPFLGMRSQRHLNSQWEGEVSVYLMDEWIMEPSDDDDEMKKTCEGESSKSGGADDA